MVNVFGKHLTKREFLKYYGDATAFAGIIPSILDSGKATNVKALRIYNGSGLDFTVLPGRALDIAWATFNAKSLAFMSKTGIVHPGYYESRGIEWLRGFFGGLLTTCGLTYFGAPNTDQGIELGIHGRATYNEAEDVCVRQTWEGDDLILSAEGKMREARLFGENIILQRQIQIKAGENVIHIEDAIENLGFEAQPYMILYHCNYGYPLLSPESQLFLSSKKTTARDSDAEANNGFVKFAEFQPSTSGFKEQVYFHELNADSDGTTTVALINKPLGLGIYQQWNLQELPVFTEWKCMAESEYVLGLEPGTATPIGRSKIREQGKLIMIQPGERKHITMKIGILTESAEFVEIIKKIQSLKN